MQCVAASVSKSAQRLLPGCVCQSPTEPEVIMHFLCSCYKWTLRASSHCHCEQECLAVLVRKYDGGGRMVCLGRGRWKKLKKSSQILPIFIYAEENHSVQQKYMRLSGRTAVKIDPVDPGNMQETAGGVEAEMEKGLVEWRQRPEKRTRRAVQSTSSLDKNLCYKSNSVNSVHLTRGAGF